MDYSFEEKLYIWLSHVFEMNASWANRLIELNGGITNLYYGVLEGTAKIPEGKIREKRGALKKLAPMSNIDGLIEKLEAHSIRAITLISKGYPKILKAIYDPPLVLYERGSKSLKDVKLPFAIIGSRNCTEYGDRMSRLFANALADYEMTIVSGLAYGCDALAAQGALQSSKSEFPTLGVLGHGVLVDKHDSTSKLVEQVISRGLILSEMLPDSPPSRFSYPMRNRIISGMSEGLLVVEAGEHSGTMITANAAMEQGRMIFAIPGRLTDRMSLGTNFLIKCGAAQTVYDPAEILDCFGLTAKQNVVKESSEKCDKLAESLSGDSKRLYELLLKGEKSFDELCEMSVLPTDKLNLYLTELEFSGLIKQLPGRVYVTE